MKFLLPLFTALLLLWFNHKIVADTLPDISNCQSFAGCYKMVTEEYAPTKSLEKFPKYAFLGGGLPARYETGGERAFVFSPRSKQWAAYDSDGYLVASGIANGGADYCPELGMPCHTPTGTFRVYRKGSADCVSNEFPLGTGGAPMPYCMFFNKGDAIHGSPYISNRNGSHGCIRVQTPAAYWLSQHFINAGTKVVVLPY